MTDYRFPVRGYPKSTIPLHWGTSPNAADLFAARGTPIQAMVSGVITYVGNDSLGGHNVLMKGDPDTKRLQYYMAHMDQAPLVRVGQRVTAGQQLGVVGDSGNAAGKGTHLHIGIGLEIKDGAGPEGGAGTPWPGNNCNKYLQFILDTIGSGGPTPAPAPTPAPPTDAAKIEGLRILADDVAWDRLGRDIAAMETTLAALKATRDEMRRIRVQFLGEG